MDIERTVRDFILKDLLYGDEGASLDDHESLFVNRSIDSIGLLRLVEFLEETYGVQILDEEVVPENLETIASIAALVRHKQATAGRR